MAKSSGHFKKAKAHSEAHNSREEVPNYLLPSEYRTPNGRGSEFIKYHDPKELFEQELAKKNATKARGKRPKFENSVWEIEVNCNEVHTLEDGQKLAKDLESLLQYTCCSVALHRDEGHMAKDKNCNYFPIYNYHFHLVFETYKDGIQYARQEHNKGIFKNELQDVIAKSLSMTRGETQKDREKRIAAKLEISLEEVQQQQGEKYKQYCERLDEIAQEKGIEDFNARLEIRPRKHINSSEYRQVAQELENTKTLTREEVEQLFNEQLQNTQITISKLETDKTALESKNQTLKQQNSEDEKTISDLKEENTVLSNSLSDITTELEVPKDENNKFKLQDIKNKVKALNADNKLRKKDLSTVCETVRKAFIGTGVPKEFYRELGAIKKSDVKDVQEIQHTLLALVMKYEDSLNNKDKEISDLKDKNIVLSNTKTELENTIQTNKQTNEQQINEITDNFDKVTKQQSEHYDTLYSITSTYVEAFKAIGTECQVTFKEGEDFATYIKKVKDSVHNTVLSNSQKPKEITKTVTREMTEEEIKQSEPYQTLSNSYDTCFNAFKTIGQDLQVCFNEGETIADYIDTVKNKVKSISKPGDFTFKVKANELKTKKFGIWSEETAQGTADRINAEIRKQITPIIQHSRAVDDDNEDLRRENKKLKDRNTVLSDKVKALTDEISLYFKALVIPYYDKAQERINSFKSWVKEFFLDDGENHEEMRTDIYRQLDTSENIDKQLDKDLGFYDTTKKTKSHTIKIK